MSTDKILHNNKLPHPLARRFNRRKFLTDAAAVVAGAATVTSFGPAKAQSSKTVTILTWETYHDDPWVAEYSESSGVPVKVVRAGSVDEMYSMTRSGAISPDVVYVDTSSTARYLAADLLVPFEFDLVPNASNIDAGLDWKTFNKVDGTVWGLPYAWGSQPLMYDADAIPDEQDTWQALWNTAFKGKVSTFDDSFLNIPMVALAIGAANPYNTTAAEDGKIRDALRELRPQIRTIARGFDDMAALFQSGDAAIAYCQNIAIVAGLQDNGKNIKVVYPKEGTPAWVDNAVVTKSGEGRSEVYDFINAGMTNKWQARFAEVSGNSCVISPKVALQNGLTQARYDSGEVQYMSDPTFWNKMTMLQEQGDLDNRLELWNEFKAGLL